MNHVFDYQSLPIHRDFHISTAYEAAVFGGYGSGKSYALCAEAVAFMLEQPGSEILLCRKTVPSLRDTSEAIFVGLLPAKFLAQCETKRMGGHFESIEFPNGSRIMFRGLDDWLKLKSLNLAGIFFDELDEIDQETYEGLLSRVRQTMPTRKAKSLGATSIDRRIIRAASNPAGQNWCWRRFVGPDKAKNSAYFTSKSLDNPFLPMQYLDSLLEMPEPWVRRYVLCGFDDFAGQIYGTWSWDTHVVRPYKDFDPDSYFWMGMDPGTADPTAGVWCYYDREAHCLVGVAEYQEPGLAASVHAAAWRRIEAKFGRARVRRRVADPTVAARDRGSNMRLSDQYQRLGFSFEIGPRLEKDRLPMLGQLIVENRFKVTDDCPRIHEQIQSYQWADLTPAQRTAGTEQKPLKKNTHLVEAAQYIASRYIAPPKIAAADPRAPENPELARQYEHDQAIRARIRKQLDEKRTATRRHGDGIIL
jgi:PBSX family phage terminase large subunit